MRSNGAKHAQTTAAAYLSRAPLLLGASVFSTGVLKTAPCSHSLNCLHLPDLVVP